MNANERVAHLLTRCGQTDSVLPPTTLFNEGWMLRLVLDWAAQHRSSIGALSFDDDSIWYSEALLPSRFRPRKRGDTAGEGFTHADGVIGHFRLRPGGRGDIELLSTARQLIVVEAKMASGLSAGTKYAPEFNQVARSVTCMAHLVSRAGIDPSRLTNLGFVLVAPATRIEEGAFTLALDKVAMCQAVARRAEAFDSAASEWCKRHLEPVVERSSIAAVSWETILSEIRTADSDAGERLTDFYKSCLRYNPLRPAPTAG
jgi:hypothetical protein